MLAILELGTAGTSAWFAAQEGRADPATRLTLLLLDGILGRLAADPGFDAAAERQMLTGTVERLLAP